MAVIGRPLPTISETTTAFTNVSSTNTSPEKASLGNGLEKVEADPPTADLTSVTYINNNQTTSLSTYKTSHAVKRKPQSATDSKRERKAAKTLAIITGE